MRHREFLLDANLGLCKALRCCVHLRDEMLLTAVCQVRCSGFGAGVLGVTVEDLNNGSLPLPCWQTAEIILVVNTANYLLLLRMRYGKKGKRSCAKALTPRRVNE